MSISRKLKRQQEREQSKAPIMDRVTKTPLAHLTDKDLGIIKSEIEHYRQDAYIQGCNDGYAQGFDVGHNEGTISGIKDGYERGWNDAYRKMSFDIINRVVSVALLVVRDDWGKFAFKKKEERPKNFGDVLAQRFNEYLGEHLDDKEKQEELRQLMLSVGFTYGQEEDKQDAKQS